MEINRQDRVLGVIAQVAIVEGRFGLLVENSESYDFGSKIDLPAIRVPATAAEAEFARYCVQFAVTDQKPPFYQTYPSYSWALRGGWDQASNVPFNADVYMTYPGHLQGKTIPSGAGCLAHTGGTYTLASGAYIYSTSITKHGAGLVVANTAEDTTDAGKLKYQSTFDDRIVAIVEHYDSSDGALTVTMLP